MNWRRSEVGVVDTDADSLRTTSGAIAEDAGAQDGTGRADGARIARRSRARAVVKEPPLGLGR